MLKFLASFFAGVFLMTGCHSSTETISSKEGKPASEGPKISAEAVTHDKDPLQQTLSHPDLEAHQESQQSARSEQSSIVKSEKVSNSEVGFSEHQVEKPTNTIDDLLLFHPTKYPRGNWKPLSLKFQDVWFTSADGTRLHGWYCPASQPRAILLYAHGNAGNISHRSHLLLRLQKSGISTFVFDYRGYGRSDGRASKEGLLQDARAARTQLATLAGVKESEIVLMGRSLGGAVVVQLAAEASPKGLILESTFSSLIDVASHHYPRLSWLVNPKSFDSVSALPQYKGPLLQSHGDADGMIPLRLGEKLFHAANHPKRFVLIPKGKHNSPQSEEYYRIFNRFINGL